MKRIRNHWFIETTIIVFCLIAMGCDHGLSHDDHEGHESHDGDEGHADHGPADEELPAIPVTIYTDQTELFMEYNPLIVGQPSRFLAHLTTMSDFRAVTSGVLNLSIRHKDGTVQNVRSDGPTRPGIFIITLTPGKSGPCNITLDYEGQGIHDHIDAGRTKVYSDRNTAIANIGEEDEEGDGGISFLKEQQWKIDFANVPAQERLMRPALPMSGTLRARSDGEAHVSSPMSGRLVTTGNDFPRIGQEVEPNQILVTLAPRLGAESDIASLELAEARAHLDVEHTSKERERLERLFAEAAIPERRLIAAQRDEAQANAELDAARRRLQQHGRFQRATDSEPTGAIEVRAPIGGTIVAVQVAPGMFLEEGQTMFQVVDLDRLWLEVRVPEANIGRVEKPAGAWFEVEGLDKVFDVPGDRVVTMGGVVNERTRTIPIIFGIDNPDRLLRVGMFARVHVLTADPVKSVSIPVDAVLEDGGHPVVYIQTEGETFERRVARLGIQDGDHIQVLHGVEVGERVVTRGAFMVKLAASSTAAPAHGHAH